MPTAKYINLYTREKSDDVSALAQSGVLFSRVSVFSNTAHLSHFRELFIYPHFWRVFEVLGTITKSPSAILKSLLCKAFKLSRIQASLTEYKTHHC